MNASIIGVVEHWLITSIRPRRQLCRGWPELFVAGFLAATLSAQAPLAQAAGSRPTRVLVKPKAKQVAAPGRVLTGARVHRTFSALGNLQVLELPASLPLQTALALLAQSKEIEYAEADQMVHLSGTEPNDFRYYSGELWGLHNTGYLGGTPGADIKAPEAWDIRHDAPNVVVALVDSGIRLTHEDLAPNLWRNPLEIPGNGIDDDGNGIIDDVFGFNAWADNGDPSDDLGHGTHVAGTIGAAGNNSVGVVGVAWKVKLMSTKFTDPQGNGTVSDAIDCIEYARKMGAQIINASWGAPDLFNSTALRDAIAAARDAGIIFVTVAGNNSGDNDATLYYPGAFDLDNIIVATATDRNDQLAFFANYGAKTVDLGAPGYNIFSSWFGSDSDYQYYNGGSMAAAHVSGAAALIRAHFPGDDYKHVIDRILKNTDPLPTLAGKTATGGRLNLFKALGGTIAPAVVSLAVTDAAAAESGPDTGVFTVTRSGSTVAPLVVLYSVTGTATNGTDYVALPGTVMIPAGAASATIVVQPMDDMQYESSETVTLTVGPSTAYTLAPSVTGVVTIADNDPKPLPTITVAATDAAASEAGDTGTFTITRAGDTSAALTVSLTVGGSATNGIDYESVSSSVTLAAGAASATIVIKPREDTAVEGNETVSLTLAANAAYVVGSSSQATITIADNDVAATLPVVTVSAVIPFTIEFGLVTGEFQVTRTGSTTAALTVKLAVSGTAASGKDYERIAGTVTIPAGKSSALVPVKPLRDRDVERTETIILNVSPQSAYQVGSPAQATVYLFDDDSFLAFLQQLHGGG